MEKCFKKELRVDFFGNIAVKPMVLHFTRLDQNQIVSELA